MHAGGGVTFGDTCASLVDLAQRVGVLVADMLLVVLALIALWDDWVHTCGEMMHFYGTTCIFLCFVDMLLEFPRCTLERSLDHLQSDFSAEASVELSSKGLLSSSSSVVGSSAFNQQDQEASSKSDQNTGALGRGFALIKASQQRHVRHLHTWSMVFACMVSVLFCFFAAHDEECLENVPSLYSYIHTFTVYFIVRSGLVVLWMVCRTVQNYEDAANFALTAASQQDRTALPPLSV